MRLTKKKAIEITIELWAWMAETGSSWKGDWPGWNIYWDMANNCALCEYSFKECGSCKCCPYFKAFGVRCNEGNEPFLKWAHTKWEKQRSKYAHEFLEKVKKLQGGK